MCGSEPTCGEVVNLYASMGKIPDFLSVLANECFTTGPRQAKGITEHLTLLSQKRPLKSEWESPMQMMQNKSIFSFSYNRAGLGGEGPATHFRSTRAGTLCKDSLPPRPHRGSSQASSSTRPVSFLSESRPQCPIQKDLCGPLATKMKTDTGESVKGRVFKNSILFKFTCFL